MSQRPKEVSRASVDAIDEERVRKVYADNPDVLHTRLAQRFGISVHRFRHIVGLKGHISEVPRGDVLHFTPYLGSEIARKAACVRANHPRKAKP